METDNRSDVRDYGNVCAEALGVFLLEVVCIIDAVCVAYENTME